MHEAWLRWKVWVGLMFLIGGCGCQGTKAARGGDPTPVDPARAERLMASATEIVATGPAAQGLPNKDRVRALLVRRLEEQGLEVRQIPFTADMPDIGLRWDLVNLMVSFEPQAKRRVLVGAHWDIRPWADEDPDPSKRNLPFDGANDGVSGMAVLLELARSLKEEPAPGLGVDIVFFDGEEGPKGTEHQLLGSRYLATNWERVTGLAVPEAGAIVDMVGRKGLRIRRERFSDTRARPVMDEIFGIAKARNAKHFADVPGQYILDDHIPFLDRGIPVVDLIDLNDPAWHTHADTLDRLDPEAMAEVTEVVLAWIRQRAARK